MTVAGRGNGWGIGGLVRVLQYLPEDHPLPENSGSGFFIYALARGVNKGLLERQKFEPAGQKAWAALTHCVNADGKLTHVQPVGADPKKFDPEHTEVYVVGAFLLAGSEVYQIHQAPNPVWSQALIDRR